MKNIVKIMREMLIIGAIITIMISMAVNAKGATSQVNNAAIASALHEQNISDTPQPTTLPVNSGAMTVMPQQIAFQPDGTVGLSRPEVQVTLVTLPTPPPLPPVVELQDVKAIYDIQNHAENIELRIALPEQPTDNAVQVVNASIQSGQAVAGQVLAVEQFKVQQQTTTEQNKNMFWLIIAVLIIVIIGNIRVVKGINLFRDKTLDIHKRTLELEHLATTIINYDTTKQS